jgi:hypothetical protein
VEQVELGGGGLGQRLEGELPVSVADVDAARGDEAGGAALDQVVCATEEVGGEIDVLRRAVD